MRALLASLWLCQFFVFSASIFVPRAVAMLLLAEIIFQLPGLTNSETRV